MHLLVLLGLIGAAAAAPEAAYPISRKPLRYFLAWETQSPRNLPIVFNPTNASEFLTAGPAILWNKDTGVRRRFIGFEEDSPVLTYNPADTTEVLTVSDVITLWYKDTARPLQSCDLPRQLQQNAAVYNPRNTSELIVAGSWEHIGSRRSAGRGPTRRARAEKARPGGRREEERKGLILGPGDCEPGILFVADKHTGAITRNLSRKVPGDPGVLAFDPSDTARLYFKGCGQPIQRFDLASATVLTQYNKSESANTVAFFATQPDQLLGACWDGFVRLWNRSTGALLREYKHCLADPYDSNCYLTGLAVNPANEDEFLSSGGDTIKLWSLASGTVLRAYMNETKSYLDGIQEFSSVAFDPASNGTRFVSISWTNLMLWEKDFVEEPSGDAAARLGLALAGGFLGVAAILAVVRRCLLVVRHP